MKQEANTIVIGAGPYGLSVAAYLKARGISIQVFGRPMEFWQKMPPKMYLKSSWSALSLFDPLGIYDLNHYGKIAHVVRQEPVPLQLFLEYSHWFQQHAVADIDQTYVKSLVRDGKQFHIDLADGRSVKASRVIVATGVSSFAHLPDFALQLPSTLASHSQDHTDFSSFKKKKVAVVGSGQSALEAAALLHEADADVELIARGPINWIDRRLYYYTGPAKSIFYPSSDVGPPGINWLVAFPLLFRRFPDQTKKVLESRAVRPAGAKWLRSRVEGHVDIRPYTTILSVKEQGQGVLLKLSDGTTREVDHIILGTGYRPNIQALTFIDSSLRQQIREHDGFPILNEWFESSLPQLHFVGAIAGYIFGPLCRFVIGAKVSARQIAQHTVNGT